MLYGVFADIHSNLEAFESVLLFLKDKKVERFICAGDVVGYGPNPNECVDLIRTIAGIDIVAGNHDLAACGLKDLKLFNEYAQKALVWTGNTLTQDNQIYLSELPRSLNKEDFSVVHGSPRQTTEEYLMSFNQYKENLPFLNSVATFTGHTHIPLVISSDVIKTLLGKAELVLNTANKYIINVGSVGQPRDSDPRAACGILDSDKMVFQIFRLEYDVDKTQGKMRKLRFPGFSIERLSWGK
jgi:predicted phosphodiesterase